MPPRPTAGTARAAIPELLEAEAYRRLAATTVGRTIVGVDAPDDWYLKDGLGADALRDAVTGASIEAVRRRGKVVLVDLTDAPTLALRFGMTGRLLVGGAAAIDRLEYGGTRDDPVWDRVAFALDDGRDLRIRDPRRLGGVHLDLDESTLGVDAVGATAAEVAVVLGGSSAPVKARLMDQRRLAGLGNLLCDELLWRAGVDPAREAGSLAVEEIAALVAELGPMLAEMGERGGSHTGDLHAQRHPGGTCPRDGTELARRTVGGRTTYSCPHHQV
ncbi:MAG: DNA-formamidopyrimidine glycosylase family protein [Actinomycetota bacterium]|nr:DNA-formamidopyrimidine glycosylase family protein [Actinomycetota bacterium]